LVGNFSDSGELQNAYVRRHAQPMNLVGPGNNQHGRFRVHFKHRRGDGKITLDMAETLGIVRVKKIAPLPETLTSRSLREFCQGAQHVLFAWLKWHLREMAVTQLSLGRNAIVTFKGKKTILYLKTISQIFS
jgi:hypothetical protein